MSLSKLTLAAIFMIAVCSPALAENTVEKPTAHADAIMNKVDNAPQASTPQNTNSVSENRSEGSKTPKTQPINIKLNQNSLLHCCSCTGSSNQRTPLDLHTPFQNKKS
jgi:hypothetical protein